MLLSTSHRTVLSLFSFEGNLKDSISGLTVPATDLVGFSTSKPKFGTYSAVVKSVGKKDASSPLILDTTSAYAPLDISKLPGNAGRGGKLPGRILVSM